MTEPTTAEIEAAAKAIILEMFAPHELPVDEGLWFQYVAAAKAALKAAQRVNEA